MTMSNGWYEKVEPKIGITQGDIILDCPITGWKNDNSIELTGKEEDLLNVSRDIFLEDVIVMTQACDLENNKVFNVILCPHYSLSSYREKWKGEMQALNQNPSPRAWKRHCDHICEGVMFNLTMLDSGESDEIKTEHRIVDFSEVYTLPKEFLEKLIARRSHPRLRLRPPYREYLSQAFARFFMRVGLPSSVKKIWNAPDYSLDDL
jgi:hypothetical protein